MTDREIMQMALDALEYPGPSWPDARQKAAEALREALAQPEQEPVAWVYQHKDTGLTMCVLVQQVESGFEKNNPRWQKSTPLYTAPPQREVYCGCGDEIVAGDGARCGTCVAVKYKEKEWQGLTDKEIENCFEMSMFGTCRAIEAKLKEKNAPNL